MENTSQRSKVKSKKIGVPLFLHFTFSILLLVGAGCSNVAQDQADQNPTPYTPPPTTSLEDTIYTSFIINVHDFSQYEESTATLNRIIDLHEEYNLPVDIYLDDAVLHIYEQAAPELLERLKTSAVVAVSWHIRPPTPYYEDFHTEWFDDLTDTELYDRLMEYETHAIDLTTGQPSEEPGGYARAAELFGYAPYIVAQAEGRDRVHQTLAEVYRNLGARITLSHGRTTALGDTANGLWLRPEDVEVKAYEKKNEISVDDLLEKPLLELTADGPRFLNLKWHENNFYSSGSNWSGIYYAPGKKGEVALDPPYDLSLWTTTQTDKSDSEERIQWERYEALLGYMTEHPEEYTVINARHLVALLNS